MSEDERLAILLEQALGLYKEGETEFIPENLQLQIPEMKVKGPLYYIRPFKKLISNQIPKGKSITIDLDETDL